ncbi:hypothetical protein P7G58_03450 [Globicatella sulfidifaciens]|uniref:hypothetical protein n=1 Tax=Globicatella sulfidifaciens TaxID=136093 RepID=UPI00288CC16D|nr:hypothetical protein [Globicatella sulfidifaciens]MDT2767919.1 hypothetical protein [Globicatella sulfidifaciens]
MSGCFAAICQMVSVMKVSLFTHNKKYRGSFLSTYRYLILPEQNRVDLPELASTIY